MKLPFSVFSFLCLFVSVLATSDCHAEEPGWYPYVIARGYDRAVIQSTPMTQRPYRPMHIYGNTVRRSYYRGNSPVIGTRIFAQVPATILRRR